LRRSEDEEIFFVLIVTFVLFGVSGHRLDSRLLEVAEVVLLELVVARPASIAITITVIRIEQSASTSVHVLGSLREQERVAIRVGSALFHAPPLVFVSPLCEFDSKWTLADTLRSIISVVFLSLDFVVASPACVTVTTNISIIVESTCTGVHVSSSFSIEIRLAIHVVLALGLAPGFSRFSPLGKFSTSWSLAHTLLSLVCRGESVVT